MNLFFRFWKSPLGGLIEEVILIVVGFALAQRKENMP